MQYDAMCKNERSWRGHEGWHHWVAQSVVQETACSQHSLELMIRRGVPPVAMEVPLSTDLEKNITESTERVHWSRGCFHSEGKGLV